MIENKYCSMLLVEDRTTELLLEEERKVTRELRRVKDELVKVIEPVEESTHFVSMVVQKLANVPEFTSLRKDICS